MFQKLSLILSSFLLFFAHALAGAAPLLTPTELNALLAEHGAVGQDASAQGASAQESAAQDAAAQDVSADDASAQDVAVAGQDTAQQAGQLKLRILDIRPLEDYEAGHIEGAVSAPYARWRGPANSPGQLVDTQTLTQLVRELGIDQDTKVVVSSSGADPTDFGAAARVYWTLKYLGLQELSILNGGLQSWVQAGFDVDDSIVEVEATDYQPVINDSVLATQEYVVAQLDQPGTVLIDARPESFFLGKNKAPTAKMPGTIKNSVNVAHDKWFEPGTALFVTPEKAKEIAQNLNSPTAEETISFCNTGHWAATDWFALSEIVGQPNAKLYPASLAEWTQASPALPMQNVPSRGQQLLDKLKGLFTG